MRLVLTIFRKKSYIFQDNGQRHDFSETEKNHVVKSLNEDMGEGDDFLRKTQSQSDGDDGNLSETGKAANVGDCWDKSADNGTQAASSP